MRLCDTDIERYLDDGIISLTPRPDNDKINGANHRCAFRQFISRIS